MTAPTGERIDTYDGLRAVAVVAVVAFHAQLGLAPGGYLGVDVFFVLSGFLITGLLLRELRSSGRIDLPAFWFRRVCRLVPAALLAVVGTSVMYALVATNPAREAAVPDARAATLWYANWHFIGEATDYFRDGVADSPFLHFWSLSVEEQFYVLWPVAVLVAVSLAPVRRALRHRAVPIAVAVVAACYAYVRAGDDPLRSYYATDTRVYQLLAGAALAACLAPVSARHGHRSVGRARRAQGGTGTAPTQPAPTQWGPPVPHEVGASDRGSVAPALLTGVEWLAVAGLALWLLADGDVAPRDAGLIATVLTVWVLLRLAPASPLHRESFVSSALARPTPVRLGRISYGVYLWHWPVIVVAGRIVEMGPVTRFAIALVGALALASASWMFVEVPIQQAARRIRRRRQMAVGIGAGLASSLAVALLLVPLALSSQLPLLRAVDRPGFTPLQGRPAPTEVDGTAEPDPAGTPAAPSPATPPTTSASSPSSSTAQPPPAVGTGAPTVAGTPVPADRGLLPYDDELADSNRCVLEIADDVADCTVVDNGAPRVLVVGDSHAARLAPAFTAEAGRSGGTVATVIMFGCPWQTTLLYADVLEDRVERQCRTVHSELIERVIPQFRPDVIVATGHPALEEGWRTVDANDPDEAAVGSAQLTRLTATAIDQLADAADGSADIVVVLPLPSAPYEPLECLDVAATIEECSFATTETTFAEWQALEDAVAGEPTARTATIHDVVCPTTTVCDAIADGMLVREDRDHLYHGFVQRHAAALAERVLGG